MAISEVIPRFGELTDNKIVLARRVTDSSRLLCNQVLNTSILMQYVSLKFTPHKTWLKVER